MSGLRVPAFPEQGPSKREVDEAIASITGGAPPPLPPSADQAAIAKLFQGWLAGVVARKDGGDNGLPMLRGAQLEIPTDDAGNYLDHFVVTTTSGVRLRVEVTPEEAP